MQSGAGNDLGLSSSVNVERKDIGVTLRVTPQISEGDTLRLKLFQEITQFNQTLTDEVAGDSAADVGVALSSRKIENTVVVNDGDTVVIGGLIAEVDEIPSGWFWYGVRVDDTGPYKGDAISEHALKDWKDMMKLFTELMV